MDHRATVHQIYADFAQGRVGPILERIAPNVDWEFGYDDAPVPWLVRGRGPEQVQRFLRATAEELEFRSFEIAAVLGEGDIVVALANLECIVRRTGKRIVEREEAHVWHFDASGRVVRFRHCADTRQQVAAFSP